MKKILLFILMFLLSVSVVNAININDPDLLIYYPFTDVTQGIDQTDNKINISVTSNPSYTPAGAFFNNAYYELPDLTGTIDYENETINFWFISNSSINSVAYLMTDTAVTNHYIAIASGDTLATSFKGGTTFASTETPRNDTWVFVSVSFGLSSANIYLNGVLVGTSTIGVSAVADKLRLGTSNAGASPLSGYIRDWTYFTRNLSTTEINDIMINGIVEGAPVISENVSSYYNINNISISLTTSTNTNMSYTLNGSSEISICNNCDNYILNLTSLDVGINNISFKSQDVNGISWTNVTTDIFPLQYFSFETSTGTPITDFYIDDVLYTDYYNFRVSDFGLGNHTIEFAKLGYATQTIDFTLNSSSLLNTTYTASDARILLYIRDQGTGALVTGTNFTVNFIASVGALTSTTTGLVNITNTLFQEESYLVVVSGTGHQTETLTFDFTNREVISLTMYVINSTDPNLGVVFIKAVNNFGIPLEGALTKALQWDSTSSSYIEVSSSVTGSDGLGTLNVILNDKVYIFTAAINGISANTSVSEIIDSTENGKTITIKLAGTAGEYTYLLENLYAKVTESFSNITNTSTINFEYSSSIGEIDVCINSYRVLRGTETLLDSNCETGTSGIFIQEYLINNSYLTVLKGIVEVDGVEYVISSFEYQPEGSFSDLLEGIGLTLFLVPLFFLGAISLAMLIENVYIGTFLMMIMGGISLALAPNILTKGIVAFLFFMGWATINYGVKSK